MRKRTECMVGVNELSQGTAAGGRLPCTCSCECLRIAEGLVAVWRFSALRTTFAAE